jgi:hypothetical protein
MSGKTERPPVISSKSPESWPQTVLKAQMIASNVAASSRQVPAASQLSIIDEIYEFAAGLRSDPCGTKDKS